MQRDHLRRHAGLQRDLELAAGAHVDAEALLADPAQHGAAAERLRGVEHPGVRAERVTEVPAPPPEVLLVAHEHRRAELRGELARVQAAEHQGAAGAARGARPDRRVEGVDVGRALRRMVGRQHVGVTRACGMGDAAHAMKVTARARRVAGGRPGTAPPSVIPVQKMLQAVDRFQQRHRWLAFAVASWKKFSDDQAGQPGRPDRVLRVRGDLPAAARARDRAQHRAQQRSRAAAARARLRAGQLPGHRGPAETACARAELDRARAGRRADLHLPRRAGRGRGGAERAQHRLGGAVRGPAGLPLGPDPQRQPDPGGGDRPDRHRDPLRDRRRDGERDHRPGRPHRHDRRVPAAQPGAVLGRVPARHRWPDSDQGPAPGRVHRGRGLAGAAAGRHLHRRAQPGPQLSSVRGVRPGARPAGLALPAGPDHPVRGRAERGEGAQALAAQPVPAAADRAGPGGLPAVRPG